MARPQPSGGELPPVRQPAVRRGGTAAATLPTTRRRLWPIPATTRRATALVPPPDRRGSPALRELPGTRPHAGRTPASSTCGIEYSGSSITPVARSARLSTTSIFRSVIDAASIDAGASGARNSRSESRWSIAKIEKRPGMSVRPGVVILVSRRREDPMLRGPSCLVSTGARGRNTAASYVRRRTTRLRDS